MWGKCEIYTKKVGTSVASVRFTHITSCVKKGRIGQIPSFLKSEVAGNGYLRFEPVRCTVSHQRQPSNGRAEGVGFNKSSSSDD